MYTIYEEDVMANKVNTYTGTLEELEDRFNSKLVAGQFAKQKRWKRRANIRPRSIKSLIISLNRAEKNISLYGRVALHVYTIA